MTWKRFISRNWLQKGDYDAPPEDYSARVNLNPKDDGDPGVGQVRRERIEGLVASMCRIAGDLRRLERDSVDEHATCAYIATRIGVDAEVVAAVLKEFFAW